MAERVALTIPELFADTVAAAPERTWLYHADETYTYAEASRRVGAMAAALAAAGAARGTRVLATTRNTPGYLFAWLALAHLGCTTLTVNPQSTELELAGYVAQFAPELVVTDRELAPRVAGVTKDLRPRPTVALIEELGAVDGQAPPSPAQPDDVVVLIPTSGTTGRSKLVMQTQRAYALAGEGFPYWMELGEGDRLMTSLPLFHINAPAYSVLGSVAARASLVLLERFSASRFIDEARRYGATEFNAIGAMLEMLMRQPERPDDPDNPLRVCYSAPAPSRERQLEIEARFGLRLVSGYGMSESPYGLIWRRGERPFGTMGSPRQHPVLGEINFVRVVDGERVCGVGEVGELELRNPAVMKGYYRMPRETEAAFHDGWLRTGDLARVEPGDVYTFVGRRKELIRRRGENLSPVEVEEALQAHPAVAEVAVVGVPSELSEEDVKAFVVPSPGVTPSDGLATELRDFAAGRLAPFKVPRYFEFVGELPHTPTGRVAKHRLARERTPAELDLERPERAR